MIKSLSLKLLVVHCWISQVLRVEVSLFCLVTLACNKIIVFCLFVFCIVFAHFTVILLLCYDRVENRRNADETSSDCRKNEALLTFGILC